MNKSIVLIVGVTAILFAGIVFLARPSEQENNQENQVLGQSTFMAEHGMFSFGTISMAQGKVNHEYRVINQGSEPITIGKVYTSCMCTEALVLKDGKTYGPYGMAGHGFIPKVGVTLEPGESMQVRAVFDPAAHGPAGVGMVQRTIIVENSDGAPLELNFEATVTP
ncbi:MAG: hypothetical protein A2842_01775 [Candidatus Wildermuthbacteria bacterium RIFCSPHIGHO2_01_FULL_48_25]|uniref:DUF1573 domain-containing protein n=1 Tax=Candidatus Wildermuthbacteria bacterium RIFCSPLOWO2_01_FULL_48_16 TaxID=1802461 RepID=A0A1G2RIX9_9BACT|nr:MAG: hypothetical protein A2842_01775 [Candidatus Wildermuthbacteria bacterium RIFCSPHIGHO2_01_FULL_48_25]OHA68496.1 MAG: hypothetical protein A3J57_02300 [Candidatus Wildermuthbacteria bacterium RIFCSPHIGHO2_02_FULL_49_12b]OHA72737.1 MAG: hypothetical protein A3B24_00675 [Candidatus Wildermuthbacteria bacterium RIFCSPLOWO2_01_FULL_48_16]